MWRNEVPFCKTQSDFWFPIEQRSLGSLGALISTAVFRLCFHTTQTQQPNTSNFHHVHEFFHRKKFSIQFFVQVNLKINNNAMSKNSTAKKVLNFPFIRWFPYTPWISNFHRKKYVSFQKLTNKNRT